MYLLFIHTAPEHDVHSVPVTSKLTWTQPALPICYSLAHLNMTHILHLVSLSSHGHNQPFTSVIPEHDAHSASVTSELTWTQPIFYICYTCAHQGMTGPSASVVSELTGMQAVFFICYV